MTPEEQTHTAAIAEFEQSTEPRRRLSWVRICGLIVLIAATVATTAGFRAAARRTPPTESPSSFAPYVDVTATPQFGFEDPSQSQSTNLVLGFVVSATKHACEPSWGAAYSLAAAATGMDLDRRIARLRQRGGEVSVSFGGVANSELSVGCTEVTKLTAAYRAVVQRYSIGTIDLDIEGSAASSSAAVARRATAIAALQAQQTAAGHPLGVWLTLPVTPQGLTTVGQAVVDAMLAGHVTLAGVNALTMDFGNPVPAGQTMASLSTSALMALGQQLRNAYTAAGVSLDEAQAWQRVGATPMIGQNDTPTERFELTDGRELAAFAQRHHLRRLSMWSVNRDRACGPNYANVEVVSDNCSGVTQGPAAFTSLFSASTGTAAGQTSTTGSAAARQTSTTGSAATGNSPGTTITTETADNPAASPYPIWNPAQAYPKNVKTVWHHNVYQAKWYTQGDMPDAPVASPFDTPWTLIGPVLPGEHPISSSRLKAGTYPAWNATQVYVAGARVLYDGVGYQAKWWTQGDVPGTAVLTPSNTAWQSLAG